MKKTIYEKHQNHQFELIEGPFEYEYKDKIYKNIYKSNIAVSHPGKFMCTTCKMHLKWTNKFEIEMYKQEYTKNMTFGQFNKRINDYAHSSRIQDPANIYLAVPFSDKDKAKRFGATWDPYHKLWYTTVRRQHADKLTPWMMPDDIEKLKKERNKYHND